MSFLTIARHRRRPGPLLLLALAAWCGMDSGRSAAHGAVPQAASPPAPPATEDPPLPAIADVEKLLAAVDQAEGQDEAAKATLKERYQKTLDALSEAARQTTAAAEFERLAAEAPGLLEAIRNELANPQQEPVLDAPPDAALAQLEGSLKQAEAALEASRKAADDLAAEQAQRRERRGTIPEQLAAVRERFAALEEQLAGAAAPEGAALRLEEARRLMLRAQRLAARQEIDRCEKELASYERRAALLPARRDRALRRVAENEKLVQAWRDEVGRRRQEEAARVAAEERRRRLEAARTAPELQAEAETNEQLASRRTGPDGLAERVAKSAADLAERRRGVAELRDRYRRIAKKLKAAGLTSAMSVLLQREYENLPDATRLRRGSRLREQQILDAQLQEIELGELRERLFDIESEVQRVVGAIAGAGSRPDRVELEAVAREILIARRDVLDALVKEYAEYVDRLVELAQASSVLVQATEEYHDFIRERIFTVASVEGGLVPAAGSFIRALLWLTDAAAWRDAAVAVGRDVASRPVESAVYALALLLVLLLRAWAPRRLHDLAGQVARIRTDDHGHSPKALLLTLLLALPLPLAIWITGTLLVRPAVQPDVALAAGNALSAATIVAFALSLLRQALRHHGLAESHFGWPEAARKRLRVALHWFFAPFLGLVLLAILFERPGIPAEYNDSVGRCSLAAAALLLAFFLRAVISPSGAVLGAYVQRHGGNLLVKSRHAWYALAVGGSIVLGLLALAGYDYTAGMLLGRLLRSLEFVAFLVLVNGLLHRWLFVTRRRLALQQLQKRREAAARAEEEGEAGGEAAALPAAEELDIPAVSAQTTQLIRGTMLMLVIGVMIWVWADVIPALRTLERIQVWPSFRVVEALEEGSYPVLEGSDRGAAVPAAPPGGAEPTAATGGAPQGMPPLPGLTGSTVAAPAAAAAVLTVADILLALVLLIVTTIAAKNIPGLLEILLLQRLPLDAGARYAITTIARYTIAIVGISIALGALGVGWGKLQWLVAAMTFGLAFGLQEIVANFISGLIMLFERPVRIGDIVTVGGIDGKVTRIRMRATTIVDWDNRELIVPNKEFITGQLVNWTLSDPYTRMVIPVGIAYGSDTNQARALLLKIAREHPAVMQEPGPSAIFRSFGDSALLFDLRVFMASRDLWPRLVDELHQKIHEEFAAAGIEIAFPQLDLHIRSARGLGNPAGVPGRMADEFRRPAGGPEEPPRAAPRA